MRADLIFSILAGLALLAYPFLYIYRDRLPWLRGRMHLVQPMPTYALVLIGIGLLIHKGPADTAGWLLISAGILGALIWRKTRW